MHAQFCGATNKRPNTLFFNDKTMKLQRQIAYKYKGKAQYKHVIVIPNETIKELGWNVGDELENSVNAKILILRSKKRGLDVDGN